MDTEIPDNMEIMEDSKMEESMDKELMCTNKFCFVHKVLQILENEMDEIRWVQEQYIKALAKETKLRRSDLKKLINKIKQKRARRKRLKKLQKEDPYVYK